jgi:resuscitation-promoting factor RpfB
MKRRLSGLIALLALLLLVIVGYLAGQSEVRGAEGLQSAPTSGLGAFLAELGPAQTITIEHGERRLTRRTTAQTVGAALAEAGVNLYAGDKVEPLPSSPITGGMTIRVQSSFPVTIGVDGRFIQTRTHHTNPNRVVAEAGITLVGDDYTMPGPDSLLYPGDHIQVVRVREDFRLEEVEIPFTTIWQADPALNLDSQVVLSPGLPGLQRNRLRVRYENGVEVSHVIDGQWIEREPISQVVGYGTKITVRQVQTEQGMRDYWRVVRMRVTSYTAASSGKEPDAVDYGITASGLPAGKGVVAVDRSVVPWRSQVFVPGYGVAIVGDTGGGVIGRWIDLGYEEETFVAWSGYVDVYYLTPVPPADDINYILPVELP